MHALCDSVIYMAKKNLQTCPKCEGYIESNRLYIRERKETGKYHYKPIGNIIGAHYCNDAIVVTSKKSEVIVLDEQSKNKVIVV